MTTKFSLLLPFFVCRLVFADDAADIRGVLSKQQDLWNQGDTKGFTAFYTEDTKFISTQVQRGRKQVEERYARVYPNKEAMGKLEFGEIEVTMLGKDYASVIGRWKLERSAQGGGNVGGYFTLLFKRTRQGWKIIQDHTS
jgi:uncharacterized protein (TIGR02246 family)